MFVLPLPIPGDAVITGTTTLQQCVTQYFVADADADARCSGCGQCTSATTQIRRQTSVPAFPTILVVQLKRFTRDRKLSTVVQYPVADFDLTEHGDSGAMYNLIALLTHHGDMTLTHSSGHYIA